VPLSPWPIERAVYSGPQPLCLPAWLKPHTLAKSGQSCAAAVSCPP